jgi:glycerol-3-phosphate acyltransferase PlsY
MMMAVCFAGLAVLLGHSRSIWLNFTGGKSAATGLGVLLAMSWPVGLEAAHELRLQAIEAMMAGVSWSP